jgi:hypothetical protein
MAGNVPPEEQFEDPAENMPVPTVGWLRLSNSVEIIFDGIRTKSKPAVMSYGMDHIVQVFCDPRYRSITDRNKVRAALYRVASCGNKFWGKSTKKRTYAYSRYRSALDAILAQYIPALKRHLVL